MGSSPPRLLRLKPLLPGLLLRRRWWRSIIYRGLKIWIVCARIARNIAASTADFLFPPVGYPNVMQLVHFAGVAIVVARASAPRRGWTLSPLPLYLDVTRAGLSRRLETRILLKRLSLRILSVPRTAPPRDLSKDILLPSLPHSHSRPGSGPPIRLTARELLPGRKLRVLRLPFLSKPCFVPRSILPLRTRRRLLSVPALLLNITALRLWMCFRLRPFREATPWTWTPPLPTSGMDSSFTMLVRPRVVSLEMPLVRPNDLDRFSLIGTRVSGSLLSICLIIDVGVTFLSLFFLFYFYCVKNTPLLLLLWCFTGLLSVFQFFSL